MSTTASSIEEFNTGIVQEAYKKWSDKGNPELFFAVVSPDIKLHSLSGGEAPLEFTRSTTGIDELKQYFSGLADQWELVEHKSDRFIAQGDFVVMHGSCHWTHKGTKKPFKTAKVDIWKMKDSKVVEFHEFFDTRKAVEAATP